MPSAPYTMYVWTIAFTWTPDPAQYAPDGGPLEFRAQAGSAGAAQVIAMANRQLATMAGVRAPSMGTPIQGAKVPVY